MKILHISDLHFEGNNEEINPGLSHNMDKIQNDLCNINADFMIVSGDLTMNGCVKQSSLVQAREWLDKLDIPYMVIPGNHDLGANYWKSKEHPMLERYEPVSLEKTNYGNVFEHSSVVKKYIGGIVFLAIVLRENDPDNTLNQLNNLLMDIDQPVILCGHYPIVETRDDGVLASFAYKDHIPTTAKALRRIIETNKQIKLYICGHVHVNSVRKLSTSSWQITSGGLGPGSSSYRLYSIFKEKLHYQTLLGAGPLSFWDNNIGTRDSVKYHLGTSFERSGQISLK